MAMAVEKKETGAASLDATGLYYREMNEKVRELARAGYDEIVLDGVNGQRYIADGLRDSVRIIINGVPGNGPTVIVNDNAQDGVGNTMNSGKIVIRGHAGDVIGYGMRGGKVFVRDDIGYRVGIHMKSYKEQVPVVIAGGRAGDFFGEYMAGGLLVLIGMVDGDAPVAGSYLGTGMHGGAIFLRGDVKEHQLGSEVREFELDDGEKSMLDGLLVEFAGDVELDLGGISAGDFKKFAPFSHRPYGNLYVY
jgi:glutamate synthase domain-containing protein 3